MLRRALVVIPVLFSGCAAPRSNPLIVTDALNLASMEVRSVEPFADPDAATLGFIQSAPSYQAPPAKPPRRLRERFNLKGGYVSSNEDGFDDGYIINVSWMRPATDVLFTEVEVGYLDASGSDNFIDRDVWAIPVMGNGRVNVPWGRSSRSTAVSGSAGSTTTRTRIRPV